MNNDMTELEKLKKMLPAGRIDECVECISLMEKNIKNLKESISRSETQIGELKQLIKEFKFYVTIKKL